MNNNEHGLALNPNGTVRFFPPPIPLALHWPTNNFIQSSTQRKRMRLENEEIENYQAPAQDNTHEYPVFPDSFISYPPTSIGTSFAESMLKLISSQNLRQLSDAFHFRTWFGTILDSLEFRFYLQENISLLRSALMFYFKNMNKPSTFSQCLRLLECVHPLIFSRRLYDDYSSSSYLRPSVSTPSSCPCPFKGASFRKCTNTCILQAQYQKQRMRAKNPDDFGSDTNSFTSLNSTDLVVQEKDHPSSSVYAVKLLIQKHKKDTNGVIVCFIYEKGFSSVTRRFWNRLKLKIGFCCEEETPAIFLKEYKAKHSPSQPSEVNVVENREREMDIERRSDFSNPYAHLYNEFPQNSERLNTEPPSHWKITEDLLSTVPGIEQTPYDEEAQVAAFVPKSFVWYTVCKETPPFDVENENSVIPVGRCKAADSVLYALYAVSLQMLELDMSFPLFFQLIWGLCGAPNVAHESIVNFLSFPTQTIYNAEYLTTPFLKKELDAIFFRLMQVRDEE